VRQNGVCKRPVTRSATDCRELEEPEWGQDGGKSRRRSEPTRRREPYRLKKSGQREGPRKSVSGKKSFSFPFPTKSSERE